MAEHMMSIQMSDENEDSKKQSADAEQIEANLRKALKDGDLQGHEYNSTFIEAWYLKKYCNVKILVNGEDHGEGWLAKNLPNWETIRVVWSHIRNEKGNKDEEGDESNGSAAN